MHANSSSATISDADGGLYSRLLDYVLACHAPTVVHSHVVAPHRHQKAVAEKGVELDARELLVQEPAAVEPHIAQDLR